LGANAATTKDVGATDTMRDARTITGLDAYQPEYVFEEFAGQAPNGTLDRAAFVSCFHNLMLSAGRDPTTRQGKKTVLTSHY
jgi:hypothetical protein